jgi:hypothetical protein
MADIVLIVWPGSSIQEEGGDFQVTRLTCMVEGVVPILNFMSIR